MRLIALEFGIRQFGPGATMERMAADFFGEYLTHDGIHAAEYWLYPVQFRSTIHVPGLYMCRGAPPPINAANTLVRPDFHLGFRQVHKCCRAPNTGRVVKSKDAVDIEWIKQLLRSCDERSPRTNVSLRSPVREQGNRCA